MRMLSFFADVAGDIQSGVNQAAGGPSSAAPAADLGTKIQHIVNLLSVVGGIAAVIVIIYAGFRLVTSGGSPDGVKSGKNAIIYAIIGLIIIALAQAIVHFVIVGIQPPPSS